LLGNAAQKEWYISFKAKYQRETNSEKVPGGKDEKNFEKNVKLVLEIAKREALETSLCLYFLSMCYETNVIIYWATLYSYI